MFLEIFKKGRGKIKYKSGYNTSLNIACALRYIKHGFLHELLMTFTTFETTIPAPTLYVAVHP